MKKLKIFESILIIFFIGCCWSRIFMVLKKMRIFLVLMLLAPGLSRGDAHDVKFPFKLFCEKNEIAWTDKKETFYKLLEGNSEDDIYFYEMSTIQSNFNEMIKTKLVMHYFDKDVLGLSESKNGLEWDNNQRIYKMNVFRKVPKIEYINMLTKPDKNNFDCEILDTNINSIDYLYAIFIKYLNSDIKKNKF